MRRFNVRLKLNKAISTFNAAQAVAYNEADAHLNFSVLMMLSRELLHLLWQSQHLCISAAGELAQHMQRICVDGQRGFPGGKEWFTARSLLYFL